ncbi:hypothetical protein I7I51_03611 [Histoplasma capsulatum]|uniref:Uncharacterized protein n=1 Tax=Ajellomyces capsulatus TaxID=5037 RepID=A0A8A1M4J2_AJECA|nr:predicted protein [Histoplasma mississippiense (nom. inval.)]EDN07125.1 predicted protein [Histoplasma mississippiense (nom. inval.)]QSS61436.1 hypothetical protein I7I51_03611 [Histoplasma capsulatum]
MPATTMEMPLCLSRCSAWNPRFRFASSLSFRKMPFRTIDHGPFVEYNSLVYDFDTGGFSQLRTRISRHKDILGNSAPEHCAVSLSFTIRVSSVHDASMLLGLRQVTILNTSPRSQLTLELLLGEPLFIYSQRRVSMFKRCFQGL